MGSIPPADNSPPDFTPNHGLSVPLRGKKTLPPPGPQPVCPRCARPLAPKKHETGIAWVCGACGGQSLNFSQFRKMIPCLHANEIWMTAMEQPAAPRWQTGCPECRRDMTAVLIPYQGREVELEICRGCQRLWLDNQEVMSNRISINDREPGRKPPVIRMTGRGAAVMVREQARRIRDRINYESTGLTRFHLLLLILYLLTKFLFWHR